MLDVELSNGDAIKCEALNFTGIVRGRQDERTENGDVIYNIEVVNKAVLRKVAIAAPHLSRL